MKRRVQHVRTIVVTGCLALSTSAQVPDRNETRKDFEVFSAELPYFEYWAVARDDPDPSFRAADPRDTTAHRRIIAAATDPKYPKAALIELLGHRDAKVRTLAATALFDREDPSVLPFLAKLMRDEAKTFDGHPRLAKEWLRMTGIGPPPRKQTVGGIVAGFVGWYSRGSSFREYWAARKDRAYCAGWFRVQLGRASHLTSPPPRDCLPRIRTLRNKIDRVPGNDRAWILLRLHRESGSELLISEPELLAACKRVAPDELMRMLRNDIRSDDPDLQRREWGDWPYRRMQLFVLQHARQLLRPGDSEELLACELRERKLSSGNRTAWWALAAARLAPDNASTILHSALDRHQERHELSNQSALYVGLWTLDREAEGKLVTDWVLDRAGLNSRIAFISAMGKHSNGREAIARIVGDRRFQAVDWHSLEELVRVINKWSKAPIVSDEDLRSLSHPYGRSHFWDSREKARREHPKASALVEAQLDSWRDRARSTVGQWGADSRK